MKYRADIDGLRAIAIIPVVLFHSGVSGFSGGYVGVDVFFVISGYVIARSLQSGLDQGQFSILKFYERRIRRIFPALFVTVLATWLAALFFLLPSAMADFSKSVVATATFVSNIFFWRTSGYFETAALSRPLLHTWSLSVEEQFYVFIPLAMFLFHRYVPRLAPSLFALAAAVSLALCIALTNVAPTASFFLLPTRAWELLIGVVLAIAPFRQPRRLLAEGLGIAGLALIAVSVATFNDATPFPSWPALLPTVGAALLITAGGNPAILVARLLSWAPLVGIGLISYSLYLFHWPIVVFTRFYTLRDPGLAEQLFIVIASTAAAWLSWRFVERPFRRAGSFGGRRMVFAAGGAALASLAAIGVIGVALHGFAARFPGFPEVASANAPVFEAVSWKENVCFLQNQSVADWKGEECIRTRGAERNAVLWGDSFAAHYLPGLVHNQALLSRNIVQYTFAGCPPILGYQSFARPGCGAFNRNIFNVIQAYDADTVVLSSRWDQLRQRGLGGLDDTVRQLQAAGVRVYVLGQSPTFAFDASELAFRQAGAGPDHSAAWEISFDLEANERVKEIVGAANYVDPLAAFCHGRDCSYEMAGNLLYADYGHFSPFGSDLAVRTYFPLIEGHQPLRIERVGTAQ